MDKEPDRCVNCEHRTICSPCVLYMSDMFNIQVDPNNEPLFCNVMKCLIKNFTDYLEEGDQSLQLIS